MEEFLNREGIEMKKYGHFPNSMCFQEYQRGKAEEALDANNEIEAFYHLIDSHAPYQRLLINALEKEDSKKLRHLDFNCMDSKIKDNIESLKQKMKEFPKEWTIVHLTPYPNIEKCFNLQKSYYTNDLFLSVFTGGKDGDDPIVLKINAPKDKNGKYINLDERFQEIIADFMGLYKTSCNENRNLKHKFKNPNELRHYLESQMKLSINQLSTGWLSELKCFLFTSFEKETDNKLLSTTLKEFLEQHNMRNLPERNEIMLKYVFRSASYLSSVELRRALNNCFSHKLDSSFYKEFLECSNNMNCMHLRRSPLILILDESLEIYPWEMISILRNAPVTRMPSLHFAHALFEHHKARIINGYITGVNYDNGTYLTNPGQDLPAMQQRMSTFMSYWLPKWEGLVGRKPTEAEFERFLQDSDIFIYNGHGDGCQFLHGDKIKYLHINAVVFLFGCASVSYRSIGPLSAMHTTLQHYLSACCPCLLGMLHAVGDKDTDLISTSLISMWIPSLAPRKWSDIDKKAWVTTQAKDIVSLPLLDQQISRNESEESNLLLALAKVKNNASLSYITRGAIVARGIPVR